MDAVGIFLNIPPLFFSARQEFHGGPAPGPRISHPRQWPGPAWMIPFLQPGPKILTSTSISMACSFFVFLFQVCSLPEPTRIVPLSAKLGSMHKSSKSSAARFSPINCILQYPFFVLRQAMNRTQYHQLLSPSF